MENQVIKMGEIEALIDSCVGNINNKSHVIVTHSSKTDAALKKRYETKNIPAASCFNYYSTAKIKRIIRKMMLESPELTSWILHSDDKRLEIIDDLKNCGRKYDGHGYVECNSCYLVLGKEINPDGNIEKIYVRTCYPV